MQQKITDELLENSLLGTGVPRELIINENTNKEFKNFMGILKSINEKDQSNKKEEKESCSEKN